MLIERSSNPKKPEGDFIYFLMLNSIPSKRINDSRYFISIPFCEERWRRFWPFKHVVFGFRHDRVDFQGNSSCLHSSSSSFHWHAFRWDILAWHLWFALLFHSAMQANRNQTIVKVSAASRWVSLSFDTLFSRLLIKPSCKQFCYCWLISLLFTRIWCV